MKKLILSLVISTLFCSVSFAQSSGLILHADSLYKEAPASQFQIDMPNYIINNTGQTVTLKWTRTLQQPFPSGWITNFCDDSLCYLNPVSMATFDLPSGDTGLLKPVFYPYGHTGTGIYRIKLESLTPSAPYLVNIVYVAVALESVGTQEQPLVVASLSPNPATNMLQLAFGEAGFRGKVQIMDVSGRILQDFQAEGADFNIDVSAFPKGAYTLVVRPDDGRPAFSKVFLKQ